MSRDLPRSKLLSLRRNILVRWGFCAALSLAAAIPSFSAQAAPAAATPPASAPAAPDPTILFNQALGSFDRGDYRAAASTIDTLLKQIPPDLPAGDKAKLNAQLEPIYFTLGATYFNLKDYPSAVTALKDYLVRYPNSARVAEVTFSLGQSSYFAKDYAAAAKSFASLENSAAFREQALLLEGLSYRESAEPGPAIAAFEKLIAPGLKSPAAASGAMQLMSLYAQQKQPQKALKMLAALQANIGQLENVVELNTVALAQGDAFLQSGDNEAALTCYRAVRTREQVIASEHDRIAALQKRLEANRIAARADPKSALKYLLSGKQLQDSIATDQQLVDDFVKLPTIYPKILYRIACAFYQMGRPWEAIVAYQDCRSRSQDAADQEPALYGIITAYTDVNQIPAARAACNQYLKEFPKGANAFTVGYLLGATALQDNDPKTAETYFGRMLADQPASTLREEMEFLLGNAQFAQGEYDKAEKSYGRYEKDYPHGSHHEETVYRLALSSLFAGNYDEAAKRLDAYLQKYPAGSFASDAKYRRDVCKYAMNKFDEVLTDTQAWLVQYPHDAQQGEVEALVGDAATALGKTDDALAAYRTSCQTATTEEVIDYSLMEAGKILQKRGDWEADAELFTGFIKTHPDSPAVVTALAQIGHAKVKEGKVDEAKAFFVETLKKYIDDPHRNSVEQILDQLASLCLRKKPAAVVAAAETPGASAGAAVATAPAPPAAAETPAATPDPGAELDDLLGPSIRDRSPTAQARILYAKAQLARLRRQPAEVDRNLLAIAAKYKPADLSPTILGLVGDALVAEKKLEPARAFYQALLDNYPKDDNVDFAYAGLGEIAFQNKQFEKALKLFQDGTDKIAANQKLKDVTVGQAKTLLALGRLEPAKKIFEQAASVREWRGETTAFCVYSLGEIEGKQGHWAEANAYYQRVYVGYQRFLPWVAKAYLGSADCLEKLGKKGDAVKTYQEMLRNPKLADFSETTEARQRLQALSAG